MGSLSAGLSLLLALTCLTHFALGLTPNGQPRAGLPEQPHIILMMADDLGWNDVSFHGSDQIPTPNIDALAFGGVILNNHYSQSLCTPSRSALLTGRYPIHTGMQHNVILASEPWGLPLRERLLSEELKSLGYSTHIIGKWHLGFHKKEYTPTYRGFDSHFGFWTGYHDYYNHKAQDISLVEYFMHNVWPGLKLHPYEGLDLRRNMELDTSSTGKYSTDLFTDEAERIIKKHGSTCAEDCENPLFLYVAYSAPHAGNYEDPLQAPADVIDRFAFIENEKRKKYAAMVSKLDESVGRVVSALDESSMLEDSIIVFISDNGAQTNGIHYNRGSNFPFKGEKISPWEGGVRTVALAWSPRIKNPGRVSNQLMHISDWMPTLVAAAGGNLSAITGSGRLPLDGINMGPAIFRGHSSGELPPPHSYDARKEVLINIDDSSKYAAMRIGDYKLIDGTTLFGFQDHWVGESGRGNRNIPPYNSTSVRSSRAAKALMRRTSKSPSDVDLKAMRSAAGINCDALWPPKDTDLPSNFPDCFPLFTPCLFDVAHDPCEKRNLFAALPGVAKRLRKRLEELRKTAASPNNKASDSNANPKFWKGAWTNWDDFPKPPFKLDFQLPFFD